MREDLLYWRSGVLRPLLLVLVAPKRRAKIPARVPTPTAQHTHPCPHSPSPPCVRELTSCWAGPEAEMVPSMIEAGGVCAGRGGCARARAPKAP